MNLKVLSPFLFRKYSQQITAPSRTKGTFRIIPQVISELFSSQPFCGNRHRMIRQAASTQMPAVRPRGLLSR